PAASGPRPIRPVLMRSMTRDMLKSKPFDERDRMIQPHADRGVDLAGAASVGLQPGIFPDGPAPAQQPGPVVQPRPARPLAAGVDAPEPFASSADQAGRLQDHPRSMLRAGHPLLRSAAAGGAADMDQQPDS